MDSNLPYISGKSFLSRLRIFWVFLVCLAAAIAAGCGRGSDGSGATPPAPGGTTSVVLLTASTANGQLSRYNVTVDSVSLTSQSGKTVNLLTTHLYPEFIHTNGKPEPLATISVPQDVYTSATVSLGGTSFTCVGLGPGLEPLVRVVGTGLGSVSAANVTVSLPTPIGLAGISMGLLLNMQVSQSASYGSSCYDPGGQTPSLTPTFVVTPVTFSAQPTNSSNGKLSQLEGVVKSSDIAGKSITVASADGSNYGGGDPTGASDPANGPNWQIKFNNSTVFQGIADSSQLTQGMAVDMDAAIQGDGSLLATRIAVPDTDTTALTLWSGPLLTVYSDGTTIYGAGTKMGYLARQQIGPVLAGSAAVLDYQNATFKISGQLTNLASLPFQASFTESNMVAGQNVAMTFHQTTIYPTFIPIVVTATLIPQTINGKVSALASEGGFTAYTVTLAPYDLFPTFAVQSGQTTVLTNPNTVIVYADSNTQKLNTNPLAAGSVMRFYGLVFNDNGSLRMDCAQINDGVAE
jgi:hypothetical protein